MKKDQVISMAVEAGAELDDGFLYIHNRVCSGFIERFAKLVEQATLERAAKELDATSARGGYGTWENVRPSSVVRALKDSNG